VSRPLLLPRLTNSETQALAALATMGQGHALALPANQHAQLKLAPLPPGQACVLAVGTHRLRIEWGGGQMALDIAPSVLDSWMQLVLGAESLIQLPTSFHEAALEHIVQWVTTGLAHAGRGEAQLTQIETATQERPTDAPHALALEVTLSNGLAMPCVLHLDSLALMLVGSLVQQNPSQSDSQALTDLPVTLNLCVGQTALPAKQMSRLQVGGLVVIKQVHVQDDGLGVLLTTALGPHRLWTATARLQDMQIILTADPNTMNTQAEQTPNSDDNTITWDEMPVHLSFDVGQKTLTFAQLRQLGAGQALSLERQIQSAVNIRANGTLIGQGQLVDIDGQLGVLINQLHSPAAEGNA
jgi:type III secretion protein Q